MEYLLTLLSKPAADFTDDEIEDLRIYFRLGRDGKAKSDYTPDIHRLVTEKMDEIITYKYEVELPKALDEADEVANQLAGSVNTAGAARIIKTNLKKAAEAGGIDWEPSETGLFAQGFIGDGFGLAGTITGFFSSLASGFLGFLPYLILFIVIIVAVWKGVKYFLNKSKIKEMIQLQAAAGGSLPQQTIAQMVI